MKETELAEKFIEYFDGQDVYQEVPANGIIDIVVVMGKALIGIEVKTRLSFEVIEQAHENRYNVNYTYIAVPSPRRQGFGFKICNMLGIGVLTYDEYEGVREVVSPQNTHIKGTPYYHKLKLEPWMKRSVAGSQNDRMTAFKATIENMVSYIKRFPGCTLKQCLANCDGYHWGSLSSARSAVYVWLQRGVIKDFQLIDGKLYLNEVTNPPIPPQ